LFNLEYPAAYTWNDIFLVLSWEKFNRYLVQIEFPLPADILIIRQVSREFVLRFYDFRPSIYITESIRDEAQKLFDETQQDLNTKIGEAKTSLLCEWGNRLDIDQQLQYSLHLTVDTIFRVAGETALTLLQATDQELVHGLLQKYKDESREINVSLDKIDEEASQDDWGKLIYRQYMNPDFADGTQDETSVTPTDHLAAWISFFKARTLLFAIRAALAEEELLTFQNTSKQPRQTLFQTEPFNLRFET